MEFKYRKAVMDDLEDIMIAINNARSFLSSQGSDQWQDGYPSKEDIINDIRNGYSYVILSRDNPNVIVATCALMYREESYNHLYEGRWRTNNPYMVMHRVAVKEAFRGQGYGRNLFQLFEQEARTQGYKSIRVDTHENNDIMRHLIETSGFSYCGKTILPPNKDRLVYEKILTGFMPFFGLFMMKI